MKYEVDVFLESEAAPIGRLAGDDHGALSFRYSENADRAISLAMPLSERNYNDFETRSFFDNLIQENNSLDAVMAQHRIERSNIAGLLYHLGRDCSGAISCVPAGDGPGKRPGHLEHDYDPIDDVELCRIMTSLRDHRRLPGDMRDPSPLAGVQGKIAITVLSDGRFAIPRLDSGAPSTHIIKVPEAGKEALVEHEYALMSMAKAIYRGGVAEVAPIEIGNVKGLLVTRFDRDISDGIVRRIHVEDFCQALGLPRGLKYQRDGNEDRKFSSERVRSLLDRTKAPAVSRSLFFEMTLLNLLLGNTDNHAKNHSLIYRGRTPELAPLYDVVPVLIDKNVTHELAFNIGKAKHFAEINPSEIADFYGSIGFGVRAKTSRVQMLDSMSGMIGVISSHISMMEGVDRKILGDMICHQLERFCDQCGIARELPERDAFIMEGGAFSLNS